MIRLYRACVLSASVISVRPFATATFIASCDTIASVRLTLLILSTS